MVYLSGFVLTVLVLGMLISFLLRDLEKKHLNHIKRHIYSTHVWYRAKQQTAAGYGLESS